MKPVGASISLPTSQALLCTSRVLLMGKGASSLMVAIGNSVENPPPTAMAPVDKPPGLIQRYRELLQTRHYARCTVKTYEQWLRRFLRFHHLRHPREMGSR